MFWTMGFEKKTVEVSVFQLYRCVNSDVLQRIEGIHLPRTCDIYLTIGI